MNFTPLAIWIIGCFLCHSLDEHYMRIDGREKEIEKNTELAVKTTIIGALIFFLIGLLS